MTKFTDNLWHDLAREHGPTLALADRPEPGRAPLLRRPRVLAGSTLGLAGIGTALVLLRGPALKVLVGKDGTEVIAPGATGENTGEGTWHLAACYVHNTGTGNAGNTGAG